MLLAPFVLFSIAVAQLKEMVWILRTYSIMESAYWNRTFFYYCSYHSFTVILNFGWD
jgi:hypothetical protein